MVEIRKTNTFAKWIDELQGILARARIFARIEPLAARKPGNIEPVDLGISEMRIDYGPGYRVCFRKIGQRWSSIKTGYCWDYSLYLAYFKFITFYLFHLIDDDTADFL